MNLEEMKQLKSEPVISMQPAKILAQVEIDKLTAEFLSSGGLVDVISNDLTRTYEQSQMIASRQLYNTGEQGVLDKRAKKKRAKA